MPALDADSCLADVRRVLTAACDAKQAFDLVSRICDEIHACGHRLLQQEEGVLLLAHASSGPATDAQLEELTFHLPGLLEASTSYVQLQLEAKGVEQRVKDAMDRLLAISLSQLADAANAVRNGAHNSNHSRLLSLPESALHAITRCVGKAARLACRQLSVAYGCPGTQLQWPLPNPEPPVSACAVLPSALPDFLTMWRWAAQLTELTITLEHSLPTRSWATIATHLPSLRSLSCPWLEQPFPSQQLPPALTALTSLTLELEERHAGAAFRSARRMQAFAQLPALLPRLSVLDLRLGPYLLPDASFTAAMQQLCGRLTYLSFYSIVVDRARFRQPSACQHALAGLAALSGSLQELAIGHPEMFGPGLSETLTSLAALTCLQPSGALYEVGMNSSCLPPCYQLPSLKRVDFGWHGLTDHKELTAIANWLGSGCSSSTLAEIQLPNVKLRDPRDLSPQPLLAACALYKGLTRLEVAAVREEGQKLVQLSGWPAAVAQLKRLRHLSVDMDVEELNSTSCWGVLTALTHLVLQVGAADKEARAADVVSQEALQQGLGRLLALQRVDLWLRGTFHDDNDGSLLRRQVLQALCSLPKLETLDLSKARTSATDDRMQAAELQVLAASSAAHESLQQVMLAKHYPEEGVTAVQHALPWAKIDLINVEN